MGIITSRKGRVIIALIVLGYLFLVFTRSFSLSRSSSTKTEFQSNQLQLESELEKVSNWKTTGFKFNPNHKASLEPLSTVRQQLSYQFPYEPKKSFPKNIWQTWKVKVGDASFPSNYNKFQQTWENVNDGYKHYVLPDEQCHELINHLYETVPDVAKAYNIMPHNILKADFFRYLILFAKGGVYSDIDTVSLKPIDTWLSANETLYDKPNNAGLVIGIEADPDRPDWADWYAKRIQFCQWTIQAKKGHPMLRELIAKITELTLERESKGQLRKVLGKDEGGDIMNWTGPGIFTDYVFLYMNMILQPAENYENKKFDEIISWKTFTGMTMPIGIDDVLVLPITSFSPNVGHMGSKSSNDPMAYVDHRFLGSWKNDVTDPDNREI